MTRLMPRAIRSIAIVALALAPPLGAAGGWHLDSEASSLSFVSVKNAAVAEAHAFTDLAGSVDGDGARLVVGLASVETAIPIRNERMRELLFEIADHPKAVFTTDLHARALDDLEVGESRRIEVSGTLALHGVEKDLTATVLVTRASGDTITVSTTSPILISADAFALGEGVEQLRQIAGLDSITPMVPVSFALVFDQAG